MEYSEVKQYLKIDKHALDRELEEHPFLYADVGEMLAKAASRRDKAKEILAITDAEIQQELHRDNEKLTDTKLKALVCLDDRHIDAFNEYIKRRAEADKWSALYESFRQRGSMIKHLADLYLANYYTSASLKAAHNVSDSHAASKGKEALSKTRKSWSKDREEAERDTD